MNDVNDSASASNSNTNADTLVLVTGGTGFVGVHCILPLLEQGYKVRTTLRSLSRKSEVLDMLRAGGVDTERDLVNLSFAEADLTKDAGWSEAVEGCRYVLHVASPIGLTMPKDENEMIRPATEGTLRVLKAARDAGVKRVVVTSSFGAVSYGHPPTAVPFTEESWTNLGDKTLSPYIKSKAIAEKAAWDFMAREGGDLELAVVNPVGVFGPTLSTTLSSAFQLLKKLLDGSMPACPQISFAVVDVRDVADLHLRAMVHPAAKNERFIAASGEPLSMLQMGAILKKTMGAQAARVPTLPMPDWIVRVSGWFNPLARNIVPQLGHVRRASSDKARKLLGWSPRTNDEAVAASARSMVELKVV